MARDPPSLLASSELRDISPTPTSVRSAKITIIHPQLRDLILPLERGRVLYPRGTTIEEQRWLPSTDQEDEGDEGMSKRGITGSTRPLLNLDFVPNCLTASATILACGGQHGELYIRDLPQPPSVNSLIAKAKATASVTKLNPFVINTALPGRSINNSIILPPSWPGDWAKASRQRQLGYIGRGSRQWEEAYQEGGEEMLERVSKGEWMTRTRTGQAPLPLGPSADDADGDDSMAVDGPDGEESDISDDMSDTDESERDYPRATDSPVSSSSVATYPNTVPFLHAPRIPHLPNPSASQAPTVITVSPRVSAARAPSVTSSRRSASFSSARAFARDRATRYSFSSQRDTSRSGQPAPMYVTSRQGESTASRPGSSASSTRPSSIVPSNAAKRSTRSGRAARDEPRIFISNNDCTVKVFSLHAVPPLSGSGVGQSQEHPGSSQRRDPRDPSNARPLERLGLGAPGGTSAMASRSTDAYEWVSHAPPRQAAPRPGVRSNPFMTMQQHAHIFRRDAEIAAAQAERDRDQLDRDREQFQRAVGMHVSAAYHRAQEPQLEERRLNKIGGTRLQVATNHSSISPDLRMMVSVGDSTDVNVFEVVEGGRDFRKIAVYNAATDAGFSTAWSKDGRKFAVASQDGQVTVWDHRSSRPMAIFHTATHVPEEDPSFVADVSANRLSTSPTDSQASSGWHVVGSDGEPILHDPYTGRPVGASTSGREAARVVKFSPEGSSRDLLVFSEENTNIHVIDAQTFNAHLILPVPHIPQGTADPEASARPRLGVEGGGWGIAGVAFDPSGDWLYSGTERTVVEWDLRRDGVSSATWSMA
ncbi:hypothetical protein IAU60_002173 [Kwoniella sp. DSM 27419]